MFVISKRLTGDYTFVFASRRGKTIFTSIGCKQKSDCEQMIAAFRENVNLFALTQYQKGADKHFFRISKDGLVLANSRKFSTVLMLQKGIDDIIKYASNAEVLDFSENGDVFAETESVVENQY